jgi:hypothetical protein
VATLSLSLGLLLLVPASAEPRSSPKSTCPASRLLPKLDREYRTCNTHQDRCSGFVNVLAQLLPKFDCRRPSDTSPVPAVWLAGDERLEKYVTLLARLKTADAEALFASETFREVLDGDLAEMYYSKSLTVEERLKKGK